MNLINRIHACSAQNTSDMLQHYMEYVRQQLDATMVSWIAGYAGKYDEIPWQAKLLNGWKVMDHVMPEADEEQIQRERDEYFASAQQQGIDPLARHALQNAGKTRVHSYAEVNHDGQWSDHWISQQFLQERNVNERLLGIYTLDEEAESYLMVDRAPGAKPFTTEDEGKLYRCLIEFPRVYYWLFLERGLLKSIQRPTSPRQREIIPLLISGQIEIEIAEQLQLKRSTVHNYIVELYRNYAVNSRHEFISLWLRELDNL